MINIRADCDVDPVFGCWLWNGKLDQSGRPIVWHPAPKQAYCIAWEAEFGAVPSDNVLDHECRRILCCNPMHLEPVTKSENELRKSWQYRCRRKRCRNGHDMTHAMVTPEMGRLCRVCQGPRSEP